MKEIAKTLSKMFKEKGTDSVEFFHDFRIWKVTFNPCSQFYCLRKMVPSRNGQYGEFQTVGFYTSLEHVQEYFDEVPDVAF